MTHVQLAEEAIMNGSTDRAPQRRKTAAATGVSIVIDNDSGYPGVTLADGSVVVLAWDQLDGLIASLQRLAAIGVQEAAA